MPFIGKEYTDFSWTRKHQTYSVKVTIYTHIVGVLSGYYVATEFT